MTKHGLVKTNNNSQNFIFKKNSIPKGWVSTEINNVCTLMGGGTPSRNNPDFFGGNIPWLTPTEIPKDKVYEISDSKEKITNLGLQKSSAKIIPQDAVLLTSRASIGYVAIAGRNVATNQGFASFICSKDTNNYFLAYWLLSNRDVLIKKATGTTFKEISKSVIKTLPILLPPLNEQKRIVSKIESIFAQIDASRGNLEKVTNLLKQCKQSVLKDALEPMHNPP